MMESMNQRLEDVQGFPASKRRKLGDNRESEKGPSWASTSTQLTHGDYTIGWICALPIELAAARAMLDKVHPALPNMGNDDNSYVLGQIFDHNIVIACLPVGIYSTTTAVTVVSMMALSFTRISFALMVGIGGGVPSQRADIRLGDVVVGTPTHDSGGVIQYDIGRAFLAHHYQRTSTIIRPPAVVLTALSSLRSSHMLGGSRIPEYLSEMVARHPSFPSDFIYSGQQQDQLFEAQYEHISNEATCDFCDSKRLVARPPRDGRDPVIHYGLIASSDVVIKSGIFRDELARDFGFLCIETGAAGMIDCLPSLVIRGISDYADSHKNQQWQGYAAATAAAYAKELLSVIPGTRKSQVSTATRLLPGQLSETENLSLTGDLKVQAAILNYNTGLLIQRLQAAHSGLGLQQLGMFPEPAEDRSLSVLTNNNDRFVPALLAQLAGSIHQQQGFPGPSTAIFFHGTSPSSLAIEADPTRPRHRGDFKIALLCALPLEADAVEAAFDKRWDNDEDVFGKAPRDQNAYSTGKIGRHNVVLAHMPGIGKETAASVAANLRSSFQGVQLAIVVGICGAVPTTPTGDEVFLGDIVISEGIIPHDFGKQYPDHFARKANILDSLGRPNSEIRAILAKLKSRWNYKNLEAKVNRYIPILQQVLGETSLYPGASQDKLFVSSYRHKHQRLSGCDLCDACSHKTDPVCDDAIGLTCEQLNCGDEGSVRRVRLGKSGANEPTFYEPKVHFGSIASGNTVMKSGEDRDEIAGKEKVIAFEMEGAGVWDTLPCLIIKGVCDYADSHKSKRWQNYAAVSAAACMKAFLESWITNDNAIAM